MPIQPSELPEVEQSPEQAALAAIRAYCGWHVAPTVRETLTVDVPAGTILQLPTRHVKEVHAVTINGADREVRAWSINGLVDIGKFSASVGSVKVDLTHGYEWEQVPDLVAVYGQLAKRAALNAGRVRSQGTGPYQVTYATLEGAPIGGSVAMLGSERDILSRYKLTWGP